MNKLLLIIFACFSYLIAKAQQQTYLFSHLGLRNGLTSENIVAVQQDDRGFIWVATTAALQRYDGQHFVNFFTGNNGGLPGGTIRNMQMDKKNRLWLLNGESSLGYLDTDNFIYHTVKVDIPASYGKTISALYIDNNDNVLLIFVNRGFITYNEKENRVAVQYNSFTLPAGWEPKHFWQDEAFNYWIAADSGILKYNSGKKIFSYRGHNHENDPVIKTFEEVRNVGYVYVDRNNNFWMTQKDPGLIIKSYTAADGKIKQWQDTINRAMKGTYFEMWGINQFKDGSAWIAGSGIFAQINYSKHTVTLVKASVSGEYSIRYDQVNSLFEDREKSIWVCTNKGLFRFNPSAQVFQVVNNRLPADEKIYNSEVTGFLQTLNDEILVSTWGNGTFTYDNNFDPTSVKYTTRNANGGMVWCLLQRPNGDVWQCMQDGHLFIYKAASKQIEKLHLPAFNNSTIRQAVQDNDGNIWLGTQGGRLIKWDKHDNSFSVKQQFKRLVSRLSVDNSNGLWACTDNDGVYHLKTTDGSIINHYTSGGSNSKGLLINGASDVLQYDDTTIIIASNGLNFLNPQKGTFRYFAEGTEIANLVKDKQGYIWMSTSVGIVCYHPLKKMLPVTFDASDGIDNYTFNTGAAAILKNSTIAFGTNHGFIVFDPQKALTFKYNLPQVQVAAFLLGGKLLPVDSILAVKELNLNYTQNSFSIQLTANSFQMEFKIYYRIDGMDTGWKQTGASGEINFNYLSPGKYILRAVCRDEKGNHGQVTSLAIHIAAPFWKTAWFYVLMLLLAGTILYWLDRQRIARKEAIQKMRSNLAGELHHEVNTALSNINILSEMARLKADTEPARSKEFIDQIHTKSTGMINAMEDILWAISPENDSMAKTLERLREQAEILSRSYNTAIDVLIDEKTAALGLNMKQRQDIFSLFKNVIAAITQKGARNIKIYIVFEKPFLVYNTELDSGNMDTLEFENLLQRYELAGNLKNLRATITINTTGNNSLIELKIPV